MVRQNSPRVTRSFWRIPHQSGVLPLTPPAPCLCPKARPLFIMTYDRARHDWKNPIEQQMVNALPGDLLAIPWLADQPMRLGLKQSDPCFIRFPVFNCSFATALYSKQGGRIMGAVWGAGDKVFLAVALKQDICGIDLQKFTCLTNSRLGTTMRITCTNYGTIQIWPKNLGI